MASIAAAALEGRITPAEANELLRFVETYLKALDAQTALQKTSEVITVEELNAARESALALINEISQRLNASELADGSPNGFKDSTD
jgi:hypothetical protein